MELANSTESVISRFDVNASSVNSYYRQHYGKRLGGTMTSFRIDDSEGDCCSCSTETCGQVMLTGCLGCKWRERSKKSSSKCDMFWFSVLTITFILSMLWLHLYMAANNMAFEIECYLNSLLAYTQWIYWYIIGLGVTALLCAYLLLMMILALVHGCLHYPIYTSHLHRFLVLVCLALLAGGTAGLYLLDHNSIFLLTAMLEFTAPFLHIGVVLIMTVLSYLIAGKWLRVKSYGWQAATMAFYVLLMLALYLSPLVLPQTMIVERAKIPKRPQLIAESGASSLMPENTVAAMNRAKLLGIPGVSMDVWRSFDDVPFLMRDNNLLRTTDVRRLFPEELRRVTTPYWNSSQLETLDAGNWFIEANPFMAAPSLPEKTIMSGQKVPFLSAVLDGLDNTTSVLVHVHEPGANFRRKNGYLEKILNVLNASQVPNDMILLVDDMKNQRISRDYQFTLLSPHVASDDEFLQGNYSGIYVDASSVNRDTARRLTHAGLMTIVHSVNCQWLFSLMWLTGVDHVVTKFPQNLDKMTEPTYTLEPTSYLIIWATVDGVSIIGVLLLWGVQIVRYQRSNDPIESMPIDDIVFTVNSYNARRANGVVDDGMGIDNAGASGDLETEFLSI